MNDSSTFAAIGARYEWRFISPFKRGRGYGFPCNPAGQVTLDNLSDRGRSNYLCTRVVVGNELSTPIISLVV